uniref:tRNA/rRNA methyltransferase SpoU type domain-containing protein n=1 Tax=Ananas comosus var. bracteatus TaxID=296719 RepID=A0A6V7PFQ3_ANACO|nr:unnamed protein product [Ananas comosus var. bracteatus]
MSPPPPPSPSPSPSSSSPAMGAAAEGAVESVVVVHNVAKRHNVGTLARSAAAFGVSEVVVVGRRDFNSFGSHGSTAHLRFRHLSSLPSPAATSRHPKTLIPKTLEERDYDICGVEIVDGAMPVTDHPFRKSTAFLLGNEGTGLSERECEICDFFVYIPQYGGGTASLNVTVAASIVLHHFGVWAGFPERVREGNKFVVAEKPSKQARRNYCAESIEAIVEERKHRKENARVDIFEENGSNESQVTSTLEAMFVG